MTIREALELVVADHEQNGHRDLRATRSRARRLEAMFNPDATELTLLDLMRYARARAEQKAAPATINRELSILRRGCSLAEIPWPSKWTKRQEAPPRSGFTSREEIERVCAYLSPGQADAARFLFLTGWRRNEAVNLRWSEVDFDRGEVRLLAGTTKNREPRTFPLYPQLKALLQQRLTRALVNAPVPEDRRVFGFNDGPHFSRCWRLACVKAGVKAILLHDFRRTAARNLLEAGVDRQVAMKLLGHKTESIFNRYRITTGKELENAAAKLSNLLA